MIESYQSIQMVDHQNMPIVNKTYNEIECSPNEEYNEKYTNGGLLTPEKNTKKVQRTSESRFQDQVSNFSLSSPNTDHAREAEEEIKDNQNIVDTEILMKEYELGKELLNKASDRLGVNMYERLLLNSQLEAEDWEIIIVFLSLLLTVGQNQDYEVRSTEE